MNSTSSIAHQDSHGKADYMGIAGSVLCLIHCLLSPALVLGSVLSAGAHTHGEFRFLDLLFVFVNGAAVYFATRRHKPLALRIFLWVSFALFSGSLFAEAYYHGLHYVGYVGSGMLIIGHVYNLFCCRPWNPKKESTENSPKIKLQSAEAY